MTILARPARQDAGRGWIPGEHRGMDFGWGSGYGIYAAAAGVVESIYEGGGWNGGWGNRIVVRINARVTVTYNHFATGTSLVSVGELVSVGQQLATMGETGDAQGVHLHFELYIDGDRVDPAPYFSVDLPGTDGSGVGVPAPSGWTVGETDFTGKYGLNELEGARWYVIEPAVDNDKTIWAIANKYGVDLASVTEWTARVAASRWAGQLLQSGSSWWDGSGTYYAGVCIALNDVAALLDATAVKAEAAQRAAVAASQVDAPQPAVDGSSATNGTPEPAPVAEPVEAEPVPEPAPAPRAVATVEDVAAAVKLARTIGESVAADPDKPPISDKVALPLWIVVGLISVTATPAFFIPTLDWAHYSPAVAQAAAALVVAWAGGVASMLGLSRFARTKKD